MTSLMRKTVTGVRWTSLNTVCTTAIQLIQLAVVSRILGPKEFGLMAMVMVISDVAGIFADIGLSSAIIQRKEPKKNELSSLYWFNVIVGVIIFSVIYLITPVVAIMFGTNEIKSLLPVTALSFLISPFGLQFKTLLQKYLLFKVLTKINVFSALIGMLATIGYALNDYGVWSLVWGMIITRVVGTGLLIVWGWKVKWLPTLHFKWSDMDGYLSFGLYRVGAMAANEISSRADQFLIGILMGPTSLGYYNIAFRLVMEPIQKINPILTSVAFPIFSMVQDDTMRLKRGFLQMIRVLMSVNAPLLIGIAAVAPIAVPLLLGEQWLAAIPLVQILPFYALIRSAGNAAGSLILAKGKANWSLYWNLGLLCIVPPVVYLASLMGDISYVALALVVTQAILFFCHYRIFIRNLLGACFSEYINASGKPILLAITMGVIVVIMSLFIASTTIASLIIQVLLGILIYAGISWAFQRELYVDILKTFPFVLNRKTL